MGLLTAVGQGSKEPPRLIVLTHEPQSGATLILDDVQPLLPELS